MSFYIRMPSGRVPRRSRISLRLASLTVLIAYPAGCLIQLIFDHPGPGVTGLALVLLAVLAFFWLAPSQVQRIAGEQVCQLDDVERDLRRRAYAFSYQVLTGLMAAGIFYLAVANDDTRLTLWAPQTYAHWNAIFWGVLLYSFTLPSAWLAWTLPAPDAEDEAEADRSADEPAEKPRARWWLWGLLASGAAVGFVLARVLAP
ncbi:hypothetical protein F1654_07010 [Alkalicaulis satelles]|uniref:Uncharacterized protein n=1 Tax=Alkalicaulis satelles TaxID=2609175 RepID=A0A5M6ZIL6_9PROT|nr:hypothetical protein [Alkalicaulis satelles]KAA5803547.1 hypothetical protein F1654_07010 [Alkalicaulis satelles]